MKFKAGAAVRIKVSIGSADHTQSPSNLIGVYESVTYGFVCPRVSGCSGDFLSFESRHYQGGRGICDNKVRTTGVIALHLARKSKWSGAISLGILIVCTYDKHQRDDQKPDTETQKGEGLLKGVWQSVDWFLNHALAVYLYLCAAPWNGLERPEIPTRRPAPRGTRGFIQQSRCCSQRYLKADEFT